MAHINFKGLPWWLSGKESSCNAGDIGSIPGLGDPLKGMATHSSILVWRIPWTEEAGGYRPQSCKESGTTEAPEHACNFKNIIQYPRTKCVHLWSQLHGHSNSGLVILQMGIICWLGQSTVHKNMLGDKRVSATYTHVISTSFCVCLQNVGALVQAF